MWNIKAVLFLITILVIISSPGVVSATQNPIFRGYVRTQTGAPISGATVRQAGHDRPFSCTADENGNPTGCYDLPIVERVSRTTVTDANGYYEFAPDSAFNCLSNPQIFRTTIAGGNCQEVTDDPSNVSVLRDVNLVCSVTVPPPPTPPPTPPPPPINRCNQACTTDIYCSDAEDGCTKCLPNGSGGKTCQPPPPPVQCNDACVDDVFCATQSNGCTKCMPSATNPAQKTCQKPPSCANVCTTPADCNQAKNGCTLCLPDQSNPNQKTCQKNPTCGTACATSDYCVTADNGCTSCIQGSSGATCGKCPPGMNYDATQNKCVCPNPGETNPHKVCNGEKCLDIASCGITTCNGDKACFADEMCKCDGFDSVKLEYPSANPFMFEAFAKVEGTDITKAGVEGMSFAMYESDKSNPNNASIIAQSPVYKPEIVSSTASKVRYKATWSLTPPQVKAGKLYRVQAKIKCVPKKKSTLADLPTNQYQSRLLGVKSANAQEPTPIPTPDYLQLKTLNFIKKVQGEQCHSMYFEMQEGIGTGQ